MVFLKVNGQSSKLLLDLYKKKSSRSSEQNSNLNQKESWPLNQFSDLSHLQTQNSLNEGRLGHLEEGPHYTAKKCILFIFLKGFPKGPRAFHQSDSALRKR